MAIKKFIKTSIANTEKILSINRISLVDSYPETNQSNTIGIYGNTTNSAAGQSFTCTNSVYLLSCIFCLQKAGHDALPTGNAVAKLYAHSGTYGTSSLPTGNALATSDNFDVSTLATHPDFTLANFIFSGDQQYLMSASTYYVIVVQYSGGDASSEVAVGTDSTSSSHSGNLLYYHDSNSTWYYDSPKDAIFYVYGGNISKISNVSL